jgi:outer membrane protein assembly factor BamB
MGWKATGKAEAPLITPMRADLTAENWIFRTIAGVYGWRQGASKLSWSVDFEEGSQGFMMIGRCGPNGILVELQDEASLLHAIDATTGKVAWKTKLPLRPDALAVAGEDIWLHGRAGKKFLVQKFSGATGKAGESRLATYGNALFAVSEHLYLTGSLDQIWASPLNGGEFKMVMPNRVRGAACRDGVIYGSSLNSEKQTLEVLAFDTRAGEPLGEVTVGKDSGHLVLTPSLKRGRVAVGVHGTKELCFFDMRKKTALWTKELDASIGWMVAGKFGLVTSGGGNTPSFLGFDAESGNPQKVPTTIELAEPVFSTDDCLIVAKTGTIESFEWQEK